MTRSPLSAHSSPDTSCTLFEVSLGDARISLDGPLAGRFGAELTIELPLATWLAAFEAGDRARAAELFKAGDGARAGADDLRLDHPESGALSIRVRARVSPARGPAERVSGAIFEVEDRAPHRQELAWSRARLATFVEGLPNAIVSVHSEDMTFLEVYGEELARLRLAPEDLIGRPVEEIYSPKSVELIRRQSELALTSGKAVTFENYFGAVTYLINMMPVELGDGRRQLLVLSTNITELRDAREALRAAKEVAERANAARLAFVAGVAHELRTPLAGIIGVLDLLDGETDEAARRRALSRLRALVAAEERLVEDLLDLAQIDAGSLRLEVERFDVVEVLAPVVTRLDRALDRGLDVSFVLPPLATSFIGDSLRIHQILDNLVTNAAKYTAAGRIAVQVEIDGEGALMLRVADTGQGIARHELPRIFDSFVRVGDAHKRAPGVGLGLAVVKRLVEQMGGMIGVESELGVGSTFTVRLPPVPPPPEEPVPPDEHASVSLAGKSVLLVEDNEVNRLILAELLRREHMEVIEAENAAEAAHALAARSFDVALVDIGLPDRSGLTVMEGLRASERGATSPCVVVALTAHTGDEHARRCLEAGADAHVAKPVAQAPLRQLLARLLARGA